MMAGRCACRQLMPLATSIANSTRFTRSRCRPEDRTGQDRIEQARKDYNSRLFGTAMIHPHPT
jgi:hypothetical protein